MFEAWWSAHRLELIVSGIVWAAVVLVIVVKAVVRFQKR